MFSNALGRVSGVCALTVVSFLLVSTGAAAEDVDRSDPVGDVRLYKASPGQEEANEGEPVEGHDDVDLTRLQARAEGNTLRLLVDVAGAIRTEAEATGISAESSSPSFTVFSYQVTIDLGADATPEGVVFYQNGEASYTPTDDGTSEPIPLVSKVVGARLEVEVPARLYGGPGQVDVAATATETVSTMRGSAGYSEAFMDFIEPQPVVDESDAPPGSERNNSPGPFAVVIVAAVGILFMGARRRA